MPPHQQGEGRSQAQDETTAAGDGLVTHQARSGGRPGKGFLADTRWSNGGWVSRTSASHPSAFSPPQR
jgi:hypothetical protein